MITSLDLIAHDNEQLQGKRVWDRKCTDRQRASLDMAVKDQSMLNFYGIRTEFVLKAAPKRLKYNPFVPSGEA